MNNLKIAEVTVGADPELFLIAENGDYISGVGKIGGSKEKPKRIDVYGHAVQEDNVAVEYNIPPAKTLDNFLKSHQFVLTYLKNQSKALGLSLAVDASALFKEDQLLTPQAMSFGCEPDYNAWTLENNERPLLTEETYFLRSCGGHIHVGFKDPIAQTRIDLIRAMDVFLGLPSLFLDADARRRKLYGKAGACRLKPYGVEYRTLSNFWLKSPEYIEWVWKGTQRAIDFVNSNKHILNTDAYEIQRTINTGDLDSASALMEYYGK